VTTTTAAPGRLVITSSYRYRRRYGHFDRAQFVPFSYCFRCPFSLKQKSCGMYCHDEFAKLFETEYNGVWVLRWLEHPLVKQKDRIAARIAAFCAA
jgi:hypothetical protein